MAVKLMKRFALLFAVVFMTASCYRSDDKTIQTPTNADNSPADEGAIHTGMVEVARKSELKGIKSIAIASGINSLLVSDGTVLDDSGIDLEILSLDDLTRTATFTINDAMTGKYPWSSGSLAVDRNGVHALIYNQLLDLKTVKSVTSLDIHPVIGRPNVRPEPWSISPDGRTGLAFIGSYFDSDESILATFDLATGKSQNKLATGRNAEYGCGCFLDDQTVVSIGYDGSATIHNLADNTQAVFKEKITQGSIQEGRNLKASAHIRSIW